MNPRSQLTLLFALVTFPLVILGPRRSSRHTARYGELTERDKANCKWETAEWAYEAWKADLFTGIYRDLEQHRKTLPEDGGTVES